MRQMTFVDAKYARLLRVSRLIHGWLGKNASWDLHHEPPWYQELRSTLVELGERKRIRRRRGKVSGIAYEA